MKKSCQEKKKERGITMSVIKVEEKKEEQGKKGKGGIKERCKKEIKGMAQERKLQINIKRNKK